jgi:hypothetical protein
MLAKHPPHQVTAQARIGRVSSVDKTRHTAQVQFEEVDGFVSWDLQVLVTRPGDYSLPEADSLVVCLILDGRLGVGFVLGAIYSEDDPAPLDDAGQRSITGDDIRLGDPEAGDKIALAPLVKDRLDALQDAFDNHTHIITVTSVDGDTATAATPANAVGPLQDVAAENVSAK